MTTESGEEAKAAACGVLLKTQSSEPQVDSEWHKSDWFIEKTSISYSYG